ncbi:Ran-binding protein 3 [Myotis brandtii]|uniref:Ran-binding protein 3-like n=1 Tax=Myotis brandtii TaxID=109478 RepID=S7PSZ8_MYOBR|nr:Ran-binding protein 3 [Myotis brandtii]
MSAVPGGGGSHLLRGLHTCRLRLLEGPQQREKSVIAQPIFVFEKREQSFKRPAEETLHEAAQPVKKNNVFMTPSLVQRSVDMNSAEQSPLKHSEHVLRPAILQPPRAQRCEKVRHHASEHCKTKEQTKNKISEKNSSLLSENMLSAGISIQLSTNQILLGAASVGCQPNEDKYSFKSCSSDFVFGENMVERVLPPRAQRCEKVRHHASEHCKTKEQTKNKISEKNSSLLSENMPSAGISIQLSTNQILLGAASVGCQPNEDKYSFKSCSSDFVFGENMVERVLGMQKLTQPQLENDSYAKEKPFKYTLKFPINSPNSRTDAIKNMSLIESAAALSSKSSPKCLLKKIDVITGEEAEYNVLKINCKLFVFNKTTPSWTERGRGALRLNDTAGSDRGAFQSRLIMRNQGSLRLILNSKLWTQMEIQRANHRNLRITATDLEDYSIKVFLIQASAKDTESLYAAIHHRLVALRSFEKQKDINQAESQAEAALPQLNCDSCDEDEDGFTQGTKNRSDPSRWTHRQSVACS